MSRISRLDTVMTPHLPFHIIFSRTIVYMSFNTRKEAVRLSLGWWYWFAQQFSPPPHFLRFSTRNVRRTDCVCQGGCWVFLTRSVRMSQAFRVSKQLKRHAIFPHPVSRPLCSARNDLYNRARGRQNSKLWQLLRWVYHYSFTFDPSRIGLLLRGLTLRTFTHPMVNSLSSSDIDGPCSPCGVCRQFAREFCHLEVEHFSSKTYPFFFNKRPERVGKKKLVTEPDEFGDHLTNRCRSIWHTLPFAPRKISRQKPPRQRWESYCPWVSDLKTSTVPLVDESVLRCLMHIHESRQC